MTSSVLIVTLPPTTGGVPTKTEILARFLRRIGYDVTIASYATLSDDPQAVVQSWQLFSGRHPQIQHDTCFDDFPWIRVGCYFPELEYSYYRPSQYWRDTVEGFDYHIAVGGTILVSNLLASFSKPHFVWCAATMIDDRRDRRRSMPGPRRFIDAALIGPVQRRLEKRLLSGQTEFLCVSDYSMKTLVRAGGDADRFRVTPVPVDTTRFARTSSAARGTIGFAGRADDPRKNIELLLRAFALLVKRDPTVRLKLTGTASPALSNKIDVLGLRDHVHWSGWLSSDELVEFYQSLDVLAFSSWKEGLGISGVEAMACGVPVVSTRCGGPESYVIDNQTGRLSEFTELAYADALWSVIDDREERQRLSDNALSLVSERFGFDRFEHDIRDAWRKTWGREL